MKIVDVISEEKRVMRHEIIHAFFYESGLDVESSWGTDGTLVDWIALQFPKVVFWHSFLRKDEVKT